MKTLIKVLSIGAIAFCGMLGAAIEPVNAAMTAAQTQAFETANSGGASITPLEVNTVLSGLVGAVAILWFCWVVMSAYKGWSSQQARGQDAMWQILRALFVLIVTIVVVS